MDIPSTTVIGARTLIDGTGAPPLERPIVVVEDGKITAVGQQGRRNRLSGRASASWRSQKDICFPD